MTNLHELTQSMTNAASALINALDEEQRVKACFDFEDDEEKSSQKQEQAQTASRLPKQMRPFFPLII